jgi:hypothetical protein
MRERDKAVLRSRWGELSRISCAQRLLQLHEPQVEPPKLADPRGAIGERLDDAGSRVAPPLVPGDQRIPLRDHS